MKEEESICDDCLLMDIDWNLQRNAEGYSQIQYGGCTAGCDSGVCEKRIEIQVDFEDMGEGLRRAVPFC